MLKLAHSMALHANSASRPGNAKESEQPLQDLRSCMHVMGVCLHACMDSNPLDWLVRVCRLAWAYGWVCLQCRALRHEPDLSCAPALPQAPTVNTLYTRGHAGMSGCTCIQSDRLHLFPSHHSLHWLRAGGGVQKSGLQIARQVRVVHCHRSPVVVFTRVRIRHVAAHAAGRSYWQRPV